MPQSTGEFSLFEEFKALCADNGVRPPRSLVHQLEPHVMFIEVLCLRRVTIEPRLAAIVGLLLPRLPNLERLDLEGSIVLPAALEILAASITKMVDSHPCFELKLKGQVIGPRMKNSLRQLFNAHPGVTIVIDGEEECFPSRMQSFRSIRRPPTPPTPEDAASSTSNSTSPLKQHMGPLGSTVADSAVGACEEEETQLERRIAEQLSRLCGPVQSLHTARFVAATAALASHEVEERQNIDVREEEERDSIHSAAAFEMPFKPPVFHPDGALCSPLRMRRDDVASNNDAAELLALKERLFLVEDALSKRQDAILGADTEPGTDVAVDGRTLKRRRMLRGETLQDVANRFGIALLDLELANKDRAAPGADNYVLVPLSLEALLTEQLVAERAQAIRATIAVRSLEEARGRTQDTAELQRLQTDAEIQVNELDRLSTAREDTQAKLRGLEVALYERKRDGWLRFLKYKQLLVEEYESIAARLMAGFEEGLRYLARQRANEAKDLLEQMARRQVPVDELELRALKRRCHALEERLGGNSLVASAAAS